MATNETFQDADRISLPVPAATPAGAPVKVGSLIAVTQTAEGKGGNAAGFASVTRKGAHKLSVVGALASIGLPVYIVTADNSLTATAGSNTLFGYNLETKGAGTGVVTVALSRV